MKSALIVQGGGKGHEPEEISQILGNVLEENGFEVEISDTLNSYRDLDKLKKLDLIVPNWCDASIEQGQLKPLREAVRCGTGIAGLHGGLCYSFRLDTGFHYMTGGQLVSHPGDDTVTYTVHIVDPGHPLTRGIKDFTVTTEQYYMHVDPANFVLTTTNFGDVVMPVSWISLAGVN